MAANPDPARITDELWYLWEQMHALEPKSKLGGIYALKPGYHSSRRDNQKNWPGNYSIVDAEDRGGPSDKAAAIDWTFPDAQAGNYATITKYSDRLMASGQDPTDHRLDGWREFYGQCDSDLGVEGYDFRYNGTRTSDPSHLWHIHLSCDRDKVTSRDNMDRLLSVLRGEPNMSELFPVFGDKGEGVKRVQYQLADLGFYAGAKDGIYGTSTATAVKKFRASHLEADQVGDGKKVTGWMTTQIDEDLRAKDAKPGPPGEKGDKGDPGEQGPAGPAVGESFTVQVVAPPGP